MSDLLQCIEIGSNDSRYSVIWLHGLGADGHDFEPIVNQLELSLPIRFIFPHAPARSITINNGMNMPAWYDIASPQIDQLEDKAGIQESQQSILKLIEREIERGVNSHNIILAGFSQGGAIALHTALRLNKPLAGIMGLSTYLPLIDSVEKELNEANKNTPIFLAHGNRDPVIPIQLATTMESFLQKLTYDITLHQYEMEHSVCAEEIADISLWIKKCFSS